MMTKFGFVKDEINFIMKKKPSFVLFEKEQDNEGLKMLHKYFVEERGYQMEVLKTLIMRYPYILSKNHEQIDGYFKKLAAHSISEDDAMKYLLEYPRLISFDLEKQMKETFFLFNLYHGINEKEVMDIFRAFPYLFCCDLDKIQRYMGEFRKYKFSKELIIKLVSYLKLI